MSLANSYFKYLTETHSGSKPKNLVGALEDFEVCSSLLFFDVHSQLVEELVGTQISYHTNKSSFGSLP